MKKLLALLVAVCACNVANAQVGNNINLDLRDTPVKYALEMVFKQAGIKNYVIENNVTGFIGTINAEKQSLESALKLIIRTNSELLTYVVENNVYIVKVRKVTPTPPPALPDVTIETPNNSSFVKINLYHIDPFDLQDFFGQILFIYQGTRQRGGMNGGRRN
jgi:hypothetical protein